MSTGVSALPPALGIDVRVLNGYSRRWASSWRSWTCCARAAAWWRSGPSSPRRGTVTGAEIEIMGKPSATAMAMIAPRLGVAAERLLVVGDDLTMETRMAKVAGAIAELTTTGRIGGSAPAAGPLQEERS